MTMIDTFDSRVLRRADGYGQRFIHPGSYRYALVPAGLTPVTAGHRYLVDVVPSADAETSMRQHNIVVTVDGTRFKPDKDAVTIKEGDLVMWNCPHATTTPFAVIGDESFFDSSILSNECGFSHAFGSPGVYRWTDANGSGIGGVVRVINPECSTPDDFRQWRQSLTTGTLVMIADGHAEPDEIEIVTGQTVYFAVMTGPGITITDARALYS